MLAAAVLIAGLSACSGKNDTGVDISGQWHLVETGDLIGEQGLDIDVYASFTSGTFVLYQKVGTGLGRYWYYEGTYTVSGDNVMTGRYSDGLSSGEVSVYERAEIPADVIDEAVPPVRSGDAVPAIL